MAKLIAILLSALIFEAIGVVFLSAGLKEVPNMKQVSVSEVVRVVKNGACNGRIWLGMLFESMFFFALLYMLSQHDVSLIWPLTSLGFVITTLAARLFLHEQVSFVRWAGVGLIVFGAGLGIYSEKAKEKQPALQPESVTTTTGEQPPAL
jgi:multidrug transporter EmrE-like cation transporter